MTIRVENYFGHIDPALVEVVIKGLQAAGFKVSVGDPKEEP